MNDKLGRVVLASSHEGRQRIDRNMLKSLGAREIVTFERADKALEYIASGTVDLVLADEELADMSGPEFVQALRKAEPSLTLPVVMAAEDASEDFVLDAVASGCSGYIVRPYSLEVLQSQVGRAVKSSAVPGTVAVMLAKARAMRREGREAEAARRVRSTSRANPARKHFQQGQSALAEKRFDAAIRAYNRALAVNKAYAEAHEGLARAWQAKGDARRYLAHLKKAALCYAEQDRFIKVRTLFVEIVKSGETFKNPFFELGVALWDRGDYAEAVLAWRRAVKLTPGDDAVVACLAKAHYMLGRKEQGERVLNRALVVNPQSPRLKRLLDEFNGVVPDGPDAPASMRSFFSRCLREIRQTLAKLAPSRAA